MVTVTESRPVGPALEKTAHVVARRRVLHAHLERARIGIGHLVGGPCVARAAHARHFGRGVAVAPVLVGVIHAHGPLGRLVVDAGRKLPRQHHLQMRRVALDRRIVNVADIDALRHLGIQVAADVERRADREDALLGQHGAPLHADLPLDARNAVIVQSHRRSVGSLARDGRRRHREGAVDAAPVVLRGHADREVLEHLPTQAELDLRHVALALVVVLHAPDVAPHGIRRVVLVVILGPVTHRTVRREAEPQTEFPRHGHLKGDVVEIERIVSRAFRLPGHRLRVVVVLPLQPEVEEERLLRNRTVRRRIEQIDDSRRTHRDTHAAHRAHRQRTRSVQFADAVHRIGGKGVYAARLRPYGGGKERRGRDEKLNQGVLHLHCTLKFCSIPKRRDYNLQISYF